MMLRVRFVEDTTVEDAIKDERRAKETLRTSGTYVSHRAQEDQHCWACYTGEPGMTHSCR